MSISDRWLRAAGPFLLGTATERKRRIAKAFQQLMQTVPARNLEMPWEWCFADPNLAFRFTLGITLASSATRKLSPPVVWRPFFKPEPMGNHRGIAISPATAGQPVYAMG